MNGSTKILLVVVLLAAAPACVFRASRQDPEKAAVRAVEFAQAALVDRDVDKAYALLDAEAQSNVPRERFAEVIADMNSDTEVTAVSATEFGPIPGKDLINIYLTGESGHDKLYYRVPMRGNEEKGYKPVGILRRNDSPSESRQPLQVTRSLGG